VVTTERERSAGPNDPVTLEELRASTDRVAGTDFGMHSPRWLSHFGDAMRQADRYRVGRVLLAGDAAHIHLPAGGQGMNMGMQDAFNLGWKLAAVVNGDATEQLLDTYNDERHAVDAETLKMIRAQTVLCDPGQRTTELYDLITHLIGFDDVNSYLSTTLSGLGVQYPMPGEHRLLGRRVPDVDISSSNGARRIYELLNTARPVLLSLSCATDLAISTAGWADRIDIVTAHCPSDSWAVPGVGTVSVPSAVLIRPDGYVSWVNDGSHDLSQLRQSLTTWCGPGAHA
jgi:FAD binding domain/Aromatic-ring hydroxylase, C-terminal